MGKIKYDIMILPQSDCPNKRAYDFSVNTFNKAPDSNYTSIIAAIYSMALIQYKDHTLSLSTKGKD